MLRADERRILRVLDSCPGVIFTTFSLSHRGLLRDALVDLLGVWSGAFSTGSWTSRFSKRTGMVGRACAVEVTFQESSEHPHIHAVFVFDRLATLDAERQLQVQWDTAARKRYLTADSAAWRQHRLPAIVPRGEPRARVAAYLTEQTARWRGRPGEGRSPGDLLNSVAKTGDSGDLARLLEFHEATKGRRKIAYSQGWDSIAQRGQSTG